MQNVSVVIHFCNTLICFVINFFLEFSMEVSTFMTRVVLVLAVFDRSADLGPKFVASSGQQLDVVFFMDETFWILGWDKRHMIAWFHRNAFGFDIGLGQSQTRVGMVRCYLPKIDHLNRTGMSANEMIRKLVNDIENHDHWQWDSKLDRCYGVVADMFQEQYGDRITAPNIAIGIVTNAQLTFHVSCIFSHKIVCRRIGLSRIHNRRIRWNEKIFHPPERKSKFNYNGCPWQDFKSGRPVVS